jgi:hypothetical protein
LQTSTLFIGLLVLNALVLAFGSACMLVGVRFAVRNKRLILRLWTLREVRDMHDDEKFLEDLKEKRFPLLREHEKRTQPPQAQVMPK